MMQSTSLPDRAVATAYRLQTARP